MPVFVRSAAPVAPQRVVDRCKKCERAAGASKGLPAQSAAASSSVMRARKLLAILATMFALACGGSPEPKSDAPAPAAAPAAQPAPEPETPKPSPITALDLPPHQVVEGEGITITEISDGSVNIKTTTLWNEPMDTTYQNCDYFRGAVPVLKQQIAKDRAKQLDKVCTKTKKAAAKPAAPKAAPHATAPAPK
jgi:hypothetical protein